MAKQIIMQTVPHDDSFSVAKISMKFQWDLSLRKKQKGNVVAGSLHGLN